MSDENVGGLVEKWREAAKQAAAAQGKVTKYGCAYAVVFRDCADELEAAISAHGENASVQTPVVDEAMAQKFWDGYEQYFVDLSADELFDGKDRKIEAAMSALTAALTGATP